MCLYKKILLNPKYLPNKKNGFNPPRCTDERFRYIEADCGKCFECRKKRAREWSIRIHENLKYEFGYFVTLTISPENMEHLRKNAGVDTVYKNENAIAKLALRRMLERIRKQTGKSIKHWCVSELGEENDRIHLHGIVFGQKTAELVRQQWGYGIVYIGTYCSSRTANYITKYMLKEDVNHKWFTGRVFTSAGIGKGYIKRSGTIWKRFKGKDTNDNYTCENGQEVAMPAYYKRKLYTDEQREALWGWKQEDKYTYVHGEKVLKTDERTIKNLTDYYQRKLQTSVFDNPIEWEERKQENRRARFREGRIKQRKEMYKEYQKQGYIPKHELNRIKIMKKNDEISCRFKEFVIHLQQQKRNSNTINKQLNLFNNESNN